MAKFKSYLGLILTILMLSAFIPVSEPHSGYPYARQITLLDNAVSTRVFMHNDDAWKLWRSATDIIARCVPTGQGGETHWNSYQDRRPTCSDLSKLVDFSLYTNQFSLTRHEPSLKEKRSNFEKTGRSFSDLGDRSIEAEELRITANKAITRFLETEQTGLAVLIYTYNGLLLVVIVSLMLNRQSFGGCIIWSLVAIARLVSRSAKKLHEKI